MNQHALQFKERILHPFKGSMFLLLKLPAAYFSGVRVMELDSNKASVSVHYNWFSKNPFRSTYFACLAMAAELSSGLLAMLQVYHRKPSVSMLVVKMEAEFYKKAKGRTVFTCENGKELEHIVESCIHDGLSRTFISKATGTDSHGDLIAEFMITWSFKAKK